MALEKVFITGASGCVGHYVVDQLLENQKLELHLMVRDPKRLKFDYKSEPRVVVHIGNMEYIETLASVISEMDYLVHVATDWSNSDYAIKLNVEKTHELFNACSDKCKRIIYFSTASILGPDNKPNEDVEDFGTFYVKSKYLAYKSLSKCRLNDRIYTLFPTLVFGGDKSHPFSHISSGLVPNKKYLSFLRFFYLVGSFHFIHSKDIAKVVDFLIKREVDQRDFILGHGVLSVKEAIVSVCKAFGIRVYFQLKLPIMFLYSIAKLFKVEVDSWSEYCIRHPHMSYKTVNPKSFGMISEYPKLDGLVEDTLRVVSDEGNKKDGHETHKDQGSQEKSVENASVEA